jgi:pheromone shutdown protein TraB
MSETPKKMLHDETGKTSWTRVQSLAQLIMVAVAFVVGFFFAGFGNSAGVSFAQWVITTLTGGSVVAGLGARLSSASVAKAKEAPKAPTEKKEGV